jgi:hypothetical protein
MKQNIHLAQLADFKRFLKFDYGTRGNLRVYGSQRPPNYNLRGIPTTVPIGLYVGKHDDLSVIQDTRWLKNELQETAFYMEYDNMDHGAFAVGWDATFLNDLIAELIKYKDI